VLSAPTSLSLVQRSPCQLAAAQLCRADTATTPCQSTPAANKNMKTKVASMFAVGMATFAKAPLSTDDAHLMLQQLFNLKSSTQIQHSAVMQVID
jgi:hypothetical protein